MTEIEKKPSASPASPFTMTPEQHRAVAAKVRAFPGEPEAQRIANNHEMLAAVIERRLTRDPVKR